MNKVAIVLTVILGLGCSDLRAQLSVGQTDGLYVKEGTTLFSEELVMVPSASLMMYGLELSKRSGDIAWPEQRSIRKVYNFSRPLPFTGTLGLRYQNDELNGNMPASLTLAYSSVATGNYKDFSMSTTSRSGSDNWLSDVFLSHTTLAEVTAVSPGSDDPATYTRLEATNMITPNGDGKNDLWIVKNLEHFPVNELMVYNREGKVVYSKVGYDNSWDGTYNGRALIEDTYYYILTIDSGKKVLKGFVSVVRGE